MEASVAGPRLFLLTWLGQYSAGRSEGCNPSRPLHPWGAVCRWQGVARAGLAAGLAGQWGFCVEGTRGSQTLRVWGKWGVCVCVSLWPGFWFYRPLCVWSRICLFLKTQGCRGERGLCRKPLSYCLVSKDESNVLFGTSLLNISVLYLSSAAYHTLWGRQGDTSIFSEMIASCGDQLPGGCLSPAAPFTFPWSWLGTTGRMRLNLSRGASF